MIFVSDMGDALSKEDDFPFLKTVMPSGRFTDAVTDAHGGDWSEWPESLRVLEFPKQFDKYREDQRKKFPVDFIIYLFGTPLF